MESGFGHGGGPRIKKKKVSDVIWGGWWNVASGMMEGGVAREGGGETVAQVGPY